MKKTALQFTNLQDLADCVYHLALRRPEIDYDTCTLTAELSPEQIGQSKNYGALCVDEADNSTIILPKE